MHVQKDSLELTPQLRVNLWMNDYWWHAIRGRCKDVFGFVAVFWVNSNHVIVDQTIHRRSIDQLLRDRFDGIVVAIGEHKFLEEGFRRFIHLPQQVCGKKPPGVRQRVRKSEGFTP